MSTIRSDREILDWLQAKFLTGDVRLQMWDYDIREFESRREIETATDIRSALSELMEKEQ